MRANKYNYAKVIQQNYGYGWDDVSEYEANSSGTYKNSEVRQLAQHDLKEYRMMGYPTRVIFRRELAAVVA